MKLIAYSQQDFAMASNNVDELISSHLDEKIGENL